MGAAGVPGEGAAGASLEAAVRGMQRCRRWGSGESAAGSVEPGKRRGGWPGSPRGSARGWRDSEEPAGGGEAALLRAGNGRAGAAGLRRAGEAAAGRD